MGILLNTYAQISVGFCLGTGVDAKTILSGDFDANSAVADANAVFIRTMRSTQYKGFVEIPIWAKKDFSLYAQTGYQFTTQPVLFVAALQSANTTRLQKLKYSNGHHEIPVFLGLSQMINSPKNIGVFLELGGYISKAKKEANYSYKNPKELTPNTEILYSYEFNYQVHGLGYVSQCNAGVLLDFFEKGNAKIGLSYQKRWNNNETIRATARYLRSEQGELYVRDVIYGIGTQYRYPVAMQNLYLFCSYSLPITFHEKK